MVLMLVILAVTSPNVTNRDKTGHEAGLQTLIVKFCAKISGHLASSDSESDLVNYLRACKLLSRILVKKWEVI